MKRVSPTRLPTTGRPPVEQRRIVARLRAGIQGGALPRGSRLPSQDELAQQFGVTKVTLNAAMGALAACGMVEIGPRGSFVAQHQPADNTYGVFFPRRADALNENAFWTALQAAVVQHRTRRSAAVLRTYYIEEHKPLVENPDFLRLQHDVEQGCLRGVICTAPPYLLDGTPALKGRALGYAGTFVPGSRWPQFMGVRLANELFITKALDYLATRGRRRVANLLPPFTSTTELERLAAGMQARGMDYRRYWQQGLHVHEPQWARNCAELLFRPGQTERPDALVIWDDNLVGAATTGLQDAGVRVPDEVVVVAHCNYPVVTPSIVPATRLGYDACEVLQTCLQLVDRRLAGEKTGTATEIGPVFDDERRTLS